MQPDRLPLSHAHRRRWREILGALGIPDKALVNRHGPCPVCGGKDRFRFDDKDGLGTFFCTHCGAGDGPKLAMLFLGADFAQMAERVRRAVGGERAEAGPEWPEQVDDVVETPQAKRDRMNRLWGKALPIRATDPAGLYLAQRLGHMPERTGLRFQPHCQYPKGDTWPAMLAVFIGPDGTPSGLHRTYLGEDGRKAPVVSPKLTLGPLLAGGAVRLSPVVPHLGIAEGIETAMAATILFGVPCWAAVNAGRLGKWEPPAGVDRVTIFADNDESFRGQTEAFDLEARIKDRVAVQIEMPAVEGQDFCDVLAAKRRAA